MQKLNSKKILSVIIALNLLIIGSFLLIYKYKQKYIVNIRQAWFSTMTAQDDVFTASPEKLIGVYGFQVEPYMLRQELHSFIEKLEYVQRNRKRIGAEQDVIKKSQAIVLLFQKEEEEGQGEFPSLVEKIRTLPQAAVYGDCSDNSDVFIALGSFFGLTVREVHNTVHVFNEIYDYQLDKWIWIDPENALMARDDKGTYLSLVEMMRRYGNNEKIDFEQFGRNKSREMKKNYFYHYYDGKEKFSYLMMTLGNNIYEVDAYRGRMRFMPKIIAQFILLADNIQPHYVIYSGNSAVITEWMYIKYAPIITTGGIVLINIALLWMVYRQRPGKTTSLLKPLLSRNAERG